MGARCSSFLRSRLAVSGPTLPCSDSVSESIFAVELFKHFVDIKV
jgi:hypothetical protein